MTLKTAPICGGIHPIFGLLLDKSDLNDGYDLKKKLPYKLITQLLTLKQSSSSERALMDARSDPPKLKFHGELGTSDDCVA